MQDYAKQLLSAINQYDADNPESVNHLRDLVCWISDNDALKKDKMLAQLQEHLRNRQRAHPPRRG